MNINLKNYQEKAIGELISSFKVLFEKEEQNKVCVFQAPTGSGKTLMTAKFIEELIGEFPDTDLCFVWISIGKGELHLQSKRSLERIFGGAPRVSLVENEFTGGRERIIRNEVVVVNWEKLRSKDRQTDDWKNILMKNGERLNFRDVLTKTREQRKVIMIIDESHIGSTADRTNELRDEINADVTLEMSATPKIIPNPKDMALGKAAYICVEPKDVIDEGMIKKELIINEKIDEVKDDETDSQEVVLEAAYTKRLELKKLFEKEGVNINPLVLVQIPTAEAGEHKIRAVQQFLADKNITERNHKLAIWLSDQKSETLEWVSESEDETEFLIFKQAIDTGWDCPRAHILVRFRESKSEIFEIQTLGRILRMPEQKHYASESLNRGHIYTNVQSILVKKEEYNPNIIKHLKSIRKEDIYNPIKLTSYYKSRVDYGDITASFIKVFEEIAREYFRLNSDSIFLDQNVKKVEDAGVSLNIKKYRQEILLNASITGGGFDEIEGEIDSIDRAKLIIAGNDLQMEFEKIIKNNLGSFTGIKRSIPTVKSAIYLWFQKYLGSQEWSKEITRVQMIFLHNGNRVKFEDILKKAVEKYTEVRKKEVYKRVEESEQWYDFEIKKEEFFNEHIDETVEHKKYIYNPCYLNSNRPSTEKSFEKLLEDNDDKVTWWWKNGVNKKDYFGIKYTCSEGATHTFYPDYLVQLTDGRLGILEVKHENDRDGGTSTKAKAEKLQEYIKEQVQKKKKSLFGGIVIENSNVWRINQKPVYDWSKNEDKDWSDWDSLKF